ncbi:hypothetical protein B6N60_00969 [Richelia sinica FACHB-800]|uniref:Uncharacterized protein n=1 Tax=Richelia sinica FACHB-800 TaxID=1357546 RepID=A0A975Y3N7_9NOST|nr:ABC transporter permease [Richelia sinica]MBD2664953.1 ABC transporter permease [Richelia sinica FACHB-800]QXE22287.1 hypothetical protein B6N60_00969 [Richelia sinica FACHB-800]
MIANFFEKIGSLNPQLFREIKGRFNPFNLIVTIASSLLTQIIVFGYQLREFPSDQLYLRDKYCGLNSFYSQKETFLYTQQNDLQQKISNYKQLKNLSDPSIITQLETQLKQVTTDIDNLRNYMNRNFCPLNEINFSLWWRDHWEYIFLTFTVIFVFTLLVGGTYLLISDLAKEEQRGTLNFIRLSPQSPNTILGGKILGVPSLIYLFFLTILPLHFWAGRSANIASSYILTFYLILAASCLFFFSAAVLFSFASRSFSSFQPWLGSGSVFLFLFITIVSTSSSINYFHHPFNWVRFFSPWDITAYLFPNLFRQENPVEKFQFFYFPIGKNLVTLTLFYLVNYGIFTYIFWQSMIRCFSNNNATFLTKGQSYACMAFIQVMFLGLSMQKSSDSYYSDTMALLLIVNYCIIVALMFILSHPRQTIIDWARYKHQNQRQVSVLDDLVWGEKSPALVAIAVNVLIACVPIVCLFVFSDPELLKYESLSKFTLMIFVSLCLMMIYATITQLTLLMKNQKRYVWSVGIVSSIIFLPGIMLTMLGFYPEKYSIVWLFSSFPWAGIQYASTGWMFTAMLFDFTVLALLNIQLNKQVKRLGESATKALLAGR